MAFDPIQPRTAALMFSLGALIGVGGLFAGLFGVGSGPFALIVPALGFFAGGAVASAVLRSGPLGTVAFGLAFVLGGIGSFLSTVGTQAMTGNESILALLAFPISFAIAWGLSGGLALALLRSRLGLHASGAGVVGFAGGGAIGGLIVGLMVLVMGNQTPGPRSGPDVFMWLMVALSLVVPPIIAGGVIARALNSQGRRPAH